MSTATVKSFLARHLIGIIMSIVVLFALVIPVGAVSWFGVIKPSVEAKQRQIEAERVKKSEQEFSDGMLDLMKKEGLPPP